MRQPQVQLLALARGDVGADSAIAGEATLAIVERRAAHVDEFAPRRHLRNADHRVVERLPRREQRAMRIPSTFDLVAGLPAALADQAPCARPLGPAGVPAVDAREAKLGVLLPVEIG